MKWKKIGCIVCVLIALLVLPALAELSYPGRPTDAQLLDWMKRPCLETLKPVDYVRIDEANFESEVIESKGAVMVLLISDHPKHIGKNASRGMTALARAIKSVTPAIKLAVWLVNETGFVSAKEFTPLHDSYGFRNVPNLQFYDDPVAMGHNQVRSKEVYSGITWDGDLLLKVDYFAREYVPQMLVF